MKRVVVTVRTNKVGSNVEDSFEIDEDWTNEEIEEYAQQTMFDLVEWDFEVVDDA